MRRHKKESNVGNLASALPPVVVQPRRAKGQPKRDTKWDGLPNLGLRFGASAYTTYARNVDHRVEELNPRLTRRQSNDARVTPADWNARQMARAQQQQEYYARRARAAS